MKKMPCLFQRDFTDQRNPQILRTVTPGCEWVLAGEGVATRKWDGTACMVKDGRLFARLDCKHGKVPPANAVPCCEPDPLTGHWPHWISVDEQPHLKWHREAWASTLEARDGLPPEDGTYECCGPKLQTNAESLTAHVLIRHGCESYPDFPRTFDGIREALAAMDIEGVVFHRGNGEMCKIRKGDFGMLRKVRGA
jgi:hypothetical protein